MRFGSERSEDGQAMAEFAMVLPMLALLTFGTLEVAIWLQQQSSLNAVAFMASRSASVVGGETAKTKGALADYASGSPAWLGRAIEGMKVERGTAGVKLDASADRFTGMISALTGGDVQGFDRLGAAARMPLEYDPKRFANAKTGPKSRFLYDYRVEKTETALASRAVGGARAAIKAVKDDVKWALDQIKKWADAQPTTVTPAPGPRPTAKPGGGGQKPNPPGPGGPGVTNPQAGLIAELKKVPNIPAIHALSPEGEAYMIRGAVMSNPKEHGSVASGSVHSLAYLSPKFEAADIGKASDKRWKTSHVIEGLQKSADNIGSDKAGLEQSCATLRKYLDVAHKIPGTPQTVAKAFEKRAATWAKALSKGVEADYKARYQAETVLFVR